MFNGQLKSSNSKDYFAEILKQSRWFILTIILMVRETKSNTEKLYQDFILAPLKHCLKISNEESIFLSFMYYREHIKRLRF